MGFIPQEVINQVIDRCDIVEVVAAYVPLKKAGRNFKALCPFHHEKTPSFVINPDKQIFHCFGCGMGGNVISFLMKQERLEFPETVCLLADKVGIPIPETEQVSQSSRDRLRMFEINDLAVKYFHQNLLSDKQATTEKVREYLKKRGVDLDAVRQLKLGLALDKWDNLLTHLRQQGVTLKLMEQAGLIIAQSRGNGFYDRFRNRIIFPIFDVKKRCIAFGARTLKGDKTAKYINSPETALYTKGSHLYGFHLAKESVGKIDQAVIVEGYMDFITPFRNGVTNIVASLGTALTIDQIRLLRRYTHNVVLLFDTDQAGEAAMMRSFDILIEEGMNVKVATLDKNEDPDSYIRKFGKETFLKRIEEARTLYDYKLNLLLKRFKEKGVESIVKISDEMLHTISKFSNAVVRSEYIKNLAQTLNVSEAALYIELNKTNQGTSYQSSYRRNTEKKDDLSKHVPAVEREILKLMLDDEEFVPLTKEQISIADFENIYIKNIVNKMFQYSDRGEKEKLKLSFLMSEFQDQNILRFMSSLVALKDAPMDNKKKIHHDCIDRLKRDRLRSRRRDIMNQMQRAKEKGDQQELQKLIVDFNQLIKG